MLNQDQVREALARLAQHLASSGVVGELYLMGGAVMILAFQARHSTKDVDAIFAPAQEVRAAAQQVAAEMDLESDWLNDAAKGYASSAGDYSDKVLPQHPNLRLLTPSTEYMLAMKVMAARISAGVDRGDKDDIRLLIRHLGLSSSEQVMTIVQRYYPASQIVPRSQYLVDEIFQEERV